MITLLFFSQDRDSEHRASFLFFPSFPLRKKDFSLSELESEPLLQNSPGKKEVNINPGYRKHETETLALAGNEQTAFEGEGKTLCMNWP